MSAIRHSLVRATAALILATSAIADEPSGSVANVPTAMSAGGLGTNAPAASGTAKQSERLREGTKLVDVVGSFQSAGGDSISFSREGGKESFRVLENLALQRVGQALENSLNAKHWVVSGIITEYRGANYLLLTKAVVQLQEGDAASQ
jgi:hypothetical protein